MATSTPWGMADSSEKIAVGIRYYGTARHGGVHLSAKKNAQVPEYMRNANGWYEEDCEWSIPATVFVYEFVNAGYKAEDIIDTFRDWYPEFYEKFYNTKLIEGQSFKRDQQLAAERNKNNYVVISAIGRGDGFVECTATLGGVRDFSEAQTFLVPDVEYANRSKYGFIINTDKHINISVF